MSYPTDSVIISTCSRDDPRREPHTGRATAWRSRLPFRKRRWLAPCFGTSAAGGCAELSQKGAAVGRYIREACLAWAGAIFRANAKRGAEEAEAACARRGSEHFWGRASAVGPCSANDCVPFSPSLLPLGPLT